MDINWLLSLSNFVFLYLIFMKKEVRIVKSCPLTLGFGNNWDDSPAENLCIKQQINNNPIVWQKSILCFTGLFWSQTCQNKKAVSIMLERKWIVNGETDHIFYMTRGRLRLLCKLPLCYLKLESLSWYWGKKLTFKVPTDSGIHY